MEYDNHLEDINWQKYLLILKRGKFIILTSFCVVFAFGLWRALTLQPKYNSEAKLLVKSSSTPSLTGLGGEDLGKVEALTKESNPLEAQSEILLSNLALKQTIEELQLKNNQGKLISINKLDSDLYVAVSSKTDVLKVKYTHTDPQTVAAVVEKLVEIFIERNINDNRAETEAARKFILKQLPRSERNLKQAELALQQFKEKHNISYLPQQSSSKINEIKELNQKIEDVQGELVDVTARLKDLTIRTNLDPEEAAILVRLSQVSGIKDMLANLQNAESELARAQTRFYPQHPTVIGLTEEVADLKKLLQERVEEKAGSTTEVNWRDLQVADLQESQIKDIVNLNEERIGLEEKLAEMSKILSSHQQEVRYWPQLEQKLNELKRKVVASQRTYETLLTRLQEINATENQNIGNIRVISPAMVPSIPANQRNKKMIVLGSGFFGILIGIALVLLLDMMDKSLKTVQDVKQALPFSLLTVIPDSNNNSSELVSSELSLSGLISSEKHDYSVSDAYQLLQANLSFYKEKPLKIITITSSLPNEGTSKICANLAAMMAQTERRVLLIDCNMRCPKQHQIWGLDNSIGLVNVILNYISLDNFNLNNFSYGSVDKIMSNTAAIENAVHNVRPNLDILTSGGMFSNTIALFETMAMKALMQKFRKTYDLVIIDAPDLNGKADAGLLGKFSDGTIFVVRTGVADSESVRAAKEFLKNSEQKVLGMVVNEESINSKPNYNLKAISGSKQRNLDSNSNYRKSFKA